MAQNVLKAADYLRISTLVNYCSDFIATNLKISNCLSLHLFSEQHNLLILKEKTYEFVYSNFEDVCNEEEFLQLNEEQLNKFILDDRRFFRSEKKLYTSLVKWVEHDKPNRGNLLLNLLKHIDVRRLEPEFITKHSLLKNCLPWHLPSDYRNVLDKVDDIKPRQTNNLVVVSERKPSRINTFYPVLGIWFAENWPLPSIELRHNLVVVVNKNLVVSDRLRFECLDLETMRWTELPQVPDGLITTEMIESEGDLYVVSENHRSLFLLRFIYKYDFSTRRWMDEHVILFPGHNNLAVHDGIFYSCGYKHLGFYHRSAKNWTFLSLGEIQDLICAVAVVGEYLYVVSNQEDLRIDRFHPSTNSWTEIGSIGQKLEGSMVRVSCTVFNKRILVYGGDDRCGFLKEYHPETNQFTSLPSFGEELVLFTIQD